ncbi:LysR substrate-binding domain-containing protein [Streptomyces sparsogenes]|uniref:LysR substrate-binding domain-containing protein n=1 Tax=Streptomyces sparsogenes TaxID=67365 RepID=UPI003850A5DF
MREQAPGVVLRFLPDVLEGTAALRDGRVDLEIVVIDHTDPETVVEPLGGLDVLGVAADGHPLTAAPVTPESFAAADHIGVSRRGRLRGPVDERLGELGLVRRVVTTVPGYATALLACRGTDLVCLAPGVPDAKVLPALGLRAFALPFALPAVGLAMAWHPRQSADGGHRWLRSLVREAVTTVLQPRAPSS